MVLITIGFRFWHDNKPLDIPQDTSIYPPSEKPPQQSLQISGYLICMIVAGWLVHILGVLVFFLTNNFTMQKLPIALCMNALTVFKMPQFVEDMLQPVNSDSGQQVDMVTGYMNYETMTELLIGCAKYLTLNNWLLHLRTLSQRLLAYYILGCKLEVWEGQILLEVSGDCAHIFTL